jgi:hypothetical protein
MFNILASVLLTVISQSSAVPTTSTAPASPATLPTSISSTAPADGSVNVTVQVLSAVGWVGDQPVVLGFARPQSWSVVTMDGTDVLMLS